MKKNTLLLILIFSLQIFAISCKNKDNFNNAINAKPSKTELGKVYFNNKEAHIDNLNNIIIANNDLKNEKELKIKFSEKDENNSFTIDNQSIHNNQDILSLVKKKKVILKKINSSGSVDEYNLYFSQLPVLSISADKIDNFPNINRAKINLDNLDTEIYINTRGKASLNFLKKSFAIYTNNDFTNYLSKIYKIKSKENIYSLYASDPDPSLIRDQVSQEIFYEKLGHNLKTQKVDGKHIDLFINNKYWGVYYISTIINTSVLKDDKLSDLLEQTWQKKGFDNLLYTVANDQSKILKDPSNFKFSKDPTTESEKLSIDLSKCDNILEKTFEPNYANSFLTTILAIKGSDNIVNNSFVAFNKGNINDFVNSNYTNGNVLHYLLWDADQSFGTYQKKINYNRYNVVFDHIDYVKDRGSLITCYLQDVNGFKNKYIHKWLDENNILPGFIKSSLEKNFKYLEQNMAYDREFIRWKTNKSVSSSKPFDENDLNLMLNWVDNRFKYLEEDFLKIPSSAYNKYQIKKINGDPVVIHRTQFNFNHFKLVPIIAKNRMETHEEASKRTNAIAIATGGFFEYYYKNQFIHDRASSYIINGPEGCDATGKYPTIDYKANPIGVFKEKNKYHSTSDEFLPALGWNDQGEYVIGDLSIAVTVTFPIAGKTLNIKYLNIPLSDNSSYINLFNNSFGKNTNTPAGTFEVTINSVTNLIESISSTGNAIIPNNGYVISFGTNSNLAGLNLATLKVGDHININYNYTESILATNTTKSFQNMDYIRSKNQNLVINGKVVQDVEDAYKRTQLIPHQAINSKWMTKRDKLLWLDPNFFPGSHPRSALCIRNDTWNLYVVDGRQPGISEGMTIHELAHHLKDEGCDQVINFDGGSSATINFRGFKMNINSGGQGKCTNISRPVADFMIIQRK
ncbi:phosphodiester glycosidase family protein [Pigmentibacter ruber]|uniref:phosphodiester glycosidase family protein n=1 Tax=Pigmentibacter ruber TaxID=2683196 RepID=UPI00131C8A09|nr:phosphodiester glycosidase family protein [Pigmentibacter ruber]